MPQSACQIGTCFLQLSTEDYQMSTEGVHKVKSVTNTCNESPEVSLARELLMGSSKAIEHQEAEGQRELVQSEVLPEYGSANPAVQALGIEWGEPVPGDPIFRSVKLPAGWTKRATDHAMWSELCDAEGVVRAEIFYKAAFYDRRAFIRATSR